MKLFHHPLSKFNEEISKTGKCLDVGALDFTQYFRIKDSHPNIEHYGIDYMTPQKPIPAGYVFKKVDLNEDIIPFNDDTFDYIIASHIIEHLNNPLDFFQDCIRVLKPGGKFYLEAPSEKSVMITGMNFDFDGFYSLNMYDDPTHTKRPWSPNSLWRLARYYQAIPIKADYVRSNLIRILSIILIPYARIFKKGRLLEKTIWFAKGWAAYLIVTKDRSGKPNFIYTIPERK
jgi:SAM-dependent methyltransferase